MEENQYWWLSQHTTCKVLTIKCFCQHCAPVLKFRSSCWGCQYFQYCFSWWSSTKGYCHWVEHWIIRSWHPNELVHKLKVAKLHLVANLINFTNYSGTTFHSHLTNQSNIFRQRNNNMKTQNASVSFSSLWWIHWNVYRKTPWVFHSHSSTAINTKWCMSSNHFIHIMANTCRWCYHSSILWLADRTTSFSQVSVVTTLLPSTNTFRNDNRVPIIKHKINLNLSRLHTWNNVDAFLKSALTQLVFSLPTEGYGEKNKHLV